ncbi:uncharacterized protein si:dkey-93h22.7 isoform X2 [Puntigrus tetrazona]|uniref:uncharacterized protein si:dkey-93h22.7 isoform X2 n=1 Tax=Puntigrus tetrazona TaxID=1606681 RepID=UPI001C8906EE|nr:uncharacterized protein si:dkey-93h22.7 isoform X2 [Puntigrus tetrazona]
METWRLALILTAISLSHPRTGALEKLAEPDLTGPSSALAGSVVEFYCELPGKPVNLSVQYELYVESDPGRLIGEYSSLSENPATFFHVITQKHDGRIICKVSGHNNTDIESSFSKGLDFRVIVPVELESILSRLSLWSVWEGQTLTLQCKKSRGTYVSYDWFWNDAPVRTPYDRNEDTLTIHRVSEQNAGDYKCVASNHNDTATFTSSANLTVHIKAPNTVPPSVVIVVFSSFALLSAAVISCCVYGVVLRRRYSRKYPERPGKTRPDEEEEEKEDYLMLEDFEEDVVQADRLSDSGDEERSVDETVQYEGGVSE